MVKMYFLKVNNGNDNKNEPDISQLSNEDR